MWEKRYLCDLGTVLQENDTELKKRGFACLDEERKKKLSKMKTEKTYWLSLGAGLLIQKAVKDFDSKKINTKLTLQMFPLQELVENLEQLPVRELRYNYGKYGKPYFSDIPMYFSLSHSGNLVYLVASDKEVGADLQQMTEVNMAQVANRFFSDDEKNTLNDLSDEQQKKEYFFRLWTRKEAYGKYTGAGIVQAVGISVEKLEKETYIFDTDKYDNYLMSVCRKA